MTARVAELPQEPRHSAQAVECHLANTLDIHSRAELARIVEQQAPSEAAVV
jgi:hypothetical protein